MAWSGLRYGVMPTQISWAFGGLLWGFAMFRCSKQHSDQHFLVASEGFEPPKLKTSDLQSDPFGRLGNLPRALPGRSIDQSESAEQE